MEAKVLPDRRLFINLFCYILRIRREWYRQIRGRRLPLVAKNKWEDF